MKMTTTLLLALTLSACGVTVAGVGKTRAGNPITGQYVTAPTGTGTQIAVTFISDRGASCTGITQRAAGVLISSFSISCTDGAKGSGTFTSDFINYRDTFLYRLTNGERGQIVFGASNLNAG